MAKAAMAASACSWIAGLACHSGARLIREISALRPCRVRCERAIHTATPSKRNLVVHVGARAAVARSDAGGRDLAAWSGRAKFPGIVGAEITAASGAGAARAVEQGQLAAEALQHHLGRVAVLARLVLPFARLQLALDVNLRALLEILLGDPAQILVEDDDAMPLGLFPPLAGRLVLPGIRRGEAQIGHW